MKDFLAAARPTLGEVDEESVTTFDHWGTSVTFYEPNDGQQALMLSMGGRGMTPETAGTFIQLFIELGDDDTQRYFRDLLVTRGSGFGLFSPGGIMDIWEGLMAEWSGKASKKPQGSPSPRRVTGGRSTATTRVKA